MTLNNHIQEKQAQEIAIPKTARAMQLCYNFLKEHRGEGRGVAFVEWALKHQFLKSDEDYKKLSIGFTLLKQKRIAINPIHGTWKLVRDVSPAEWIEMRKKHDRRKKRGPYKLKNTSSTSTASHSVTHLKTLVSMGLISEDKIYELAAKALNVV